MKREYLLAVGVMTGNSLDAADVVLTKIDRDLTIEDVCTHSKTSSKALTFFLNKLREVINRCKGDMLSSVQSFDNLQLVEPQAYLDELTGQHEHPITFAVVVDAYMEFVATAIAELRAKVKNQYGEKYTDAIDIIGFHGQTCAHYPPAIAKTKDRHAVYTVQIGNGQQLADITGIPVVYDFRSDDLMNAGEAAPFATVHHQHLAMQARKKGVFPLAFCNAGNTGNISIISTLAGSDAVKVTGWDTAPFNNYPDKLMQAECGETCDYDGRMGAQGTIHTELLRVLFERAVVTKNKDNYLLMPPPKSSDPEWYVLLPELLGSAPIAGEVLSLADRIRTAEYFAVYAFVHSLSLLSDDITMPDHFALCGGGWKNPVCRNHFVGLLKAEPGNPELPEHVALFSALRKRIGGSPIIFPSSQVGFDGTAMEARIFADAAVCRIMGVPFTRPETTGAKSDTICGMLCFPENDKTRVTPVLAEWLAAFNTSATPGIKSTDPRWNRAVAGWSLRTP